LKLARELGRRPDRMQRSPGQDEPRVPGHPPHQVTSGVRLAGARRSVQEQAALEVLTGGQQRVAVSRNPQGVTLHASEDRFGQHDILSGRARDLGELEHDTTHRINGYVQDVRAIDVELTAKLPQPGLYRLRRLHLQARDLQVQTRIVLGGAVDHDHIPAALIGDQKQTKSEAGKRRARPVGQVH
jgi:hypothetical protein